MRMHIKVWAVATCLFVLELASGTTVHAQVIQQAVGGVTVDVDGVLTNVDPQQRTQLRDLRQQALAAVPADLSQPTELRCVSLKKLDQTIAECLKAGKALPDEVRYLAGLQRVQYVFVYPDQKDVVIAGPAEGWTVNPAGEVVGNASGRPVLHLDDLLVALRYADAARSGGMSVSIEPTPQGLQQLNAFLARQKTIGPNPEATARQMEQQLGKQAILINGVPPESRFANVLVAADYRMKRLGMGLDPSPVAGLKSYLELAQPGGSPMPRWWLAPRYEPLATDGQGTAWELCGQGVQAMAEEDVFDAAGQRTKSNKATGAVQKVAELMTAHYEELSAKDAIFAQLRNCMDLAVVGALIAKEHLLEKADLHPAVLFDAKQLPTVGYNPPRHIDSQASLMRKGKTWLTTVSGGVQLQPWQFVQDAEKSEAVGPVRTAVASANATGWYWNN